MTRVTSRLLRANAARASSPWLESITGQSVSIFGVFHAHPVTVMMIAGIVVQGLAESFISPRYLEYFSLQAPKGEEGLYLGFSHLHSFLSSILGFGISGYLLTAYAPDPAILAPEQIATAYDHAHYIWYYFAAIGMTAAIALLIYRAVFDRRDRNNLPPETKTIDPKAV
ncbi:MAG: MFS transporter [Ignavibacteriaceae bacterium]